MSVTNDWRYSLNSVRIVIIDLFEASRIKMLLANLGYIFFYIVGIFLSIFINATYYFNYYSDKYFENPPTDKSEYEFIVVGSGSSGSVVAGRLAEAGHKILLVEAGGPSHFLQVGIAGLTWNAIS